MARTRREFMGHGLKTAAGLAVAAPAAVLLEACGGSGSSSRPGPRLSAPTATEIQNAKGTVKVLGWEYYEVPAFNGADVRGKWGYLGTNEDTITKTRQPGSYDLTTILSAYEPQLLKAGRIQPLAPRVIPNFSKIDAIFRDSSTIRHGGEVYGIPMQWGYGYLEYDKRQTSKPKSLDDLMSPKLRKKIGLPDDPYTVITTFAILTGKKNPNELTNSEFDDVIAALDRFKSQILTIHQYGEEPPIIARGDMAIDFPAYGPSFLTARAGGAKTEITLLGAFSYVDCMTLYEGANVPAAYKYIDQTLTVPAQRACVKKGAAFPVLSAAKDQLPPELRYDSATAIIQQAPLLPGPPADAVGGHVPFSEWLKAWENFKASV